MSGCLQCCEFSQFHFFQFFKNNFRFHTITESERRLEREREEIFKILNFSKTVLYTYTVNLKISYFVLRQREREREKRSSKT